MRAHGRRHRRRARENTDSVGDARGFSDRQTLNRFGERSCVGGHKNLRRRRACTSVFVELVIKPFAAAWIPERSATRLREADLNVLSKLGNQGLEWRLEPEAFTGGEVGREDDLLDVLVGCPVDIQVARQPST